MHKNCHIRDTNKYLRLEHQRLLEKMPRLVRREEERLLSVHWYERNCLLGDALIVKPA